MATLKTQGTELYILDADDSGSEVTKIAQVTGGSGVGGTAGEIPATNLDSLAIEIVTGLIDNGTVTLNIDWDPQNAGHQKLDDLVGGANVRFIIAMSESATQPTFAAPNFTLPTDRTTLDYTGGVLSFQKDFTADDIWRATVNIRVSGALTITPAA